MDCETQALLADIATRDNESMNAGAFQSQEHLCTRCSCELNSKTSPKSSSCQTNSRLILFCVAILFSVIIFALLVAQMAVASVSVIGIFVVIWTDVTITTLAVLLHMGRRRNAHRKLGRTVTQIRLLSALGVSWLLLMVGMIVQNPHRSVCGGRWYDIDSCGLFTSAHVFSWLLIVTLFSAAFATYRKAVATHGTDMVPLPSPPLIPAWRLSTVADVSNVARAIKI
ncbi:hypothetical protein DFH06DRAFT_1386413 [Mycena polygramma]|nr:hypothetical protein DFH06DRAFT_1386413 [Mycena polygramma]